MPGEFQDPEDPHDAEDLNDAPHVLELQDALVGLCEEDGDVIWQDGQQVNDIEWAFKELPLIW